VDWILNASYDAYARAMATDGFWPSAVPTLPGLEVVEAPTPAPAAATPSAG
jgi:hypothetical protein